MREREEKRDKKGVREGRKENGMKRGWEGRKRRYERSSRREVVAVDGSS